MRRSIPIGNSRNGDTVGNVIVRDYGDSGFTVQYAMLDHAKRFPDKSKRPDYLLWSGLRIHTAKCLPIPKRGIVRGKFVSSDSKVRQGFDLKMNDGSIELANGECVPLLRTWRDEQLPDTVEYPFDCRDGRLWVWNIYEMSYLRGERVEEKWTENAGFWVESLDEFEWVFHCSHGMATPPDFASLVFKISIMPH
jgi:hypothetical protein